MKVRGNFAITMVIIAILLPFVLFAGDPDIHDGLVALLCDGRCAEGGEGG